MIRYIKRFTGNKKLVRYDLVLQQMGNDNQWHDLIKENAGWETPEQEALFNKAEAFEYSRSR